MPSLFTHYETVNVTWSSDGIVGHLLPASVTSIPDVYNQQLLAASQSQQQQMMLTTVNHCCQLLCLQQREIMALKSAVNTVSVLASKYTGRSLCIRFFLYDFALTLLETLHCISNLCDNVLFNAIWHWQYLIIFGLMWCGICDTWVRITMAWRILRLQMKEQPPIWRVAVNILNKQSQRADKGWSSSLGVGRGANNSSP